MRGHVMEDSSHTIPPSRFESSLLLLAVACVTLWGALGIVSMVAMVLVIRLPGAKVPSWHSFTLLAAAFLLSGAVTMLLSRRWLRPARGFGPVLRVIGVIGDSHLFIER